jgi:hypothetical protein
MLRSVAVWCDPVQAFNGHAAAPSSSTEPVLARVEIRKFSHTFRAGSALRMWIDSPVEAVLGIAA